MVCIYTSLRFYNPYYHAIGKAIVVHLPEGCCPCCTEGPEGGISGTARQWFTVQEALHQQI